MMKKYFFILTALAGFSAALIGCSGGDNPGRAYMPDMTYSVAYETYTPAQERLKNSSTDIDPYYNAMPVPGTVARGEMASFELKGDSLGYSLSASVVNPLDKSTINMKEAERLYLVNCGICHGSKLDGNGPLWKGGDGPYTAKPATLVGDAKYEAMKEGTMFHAVTFGKGAMGSYASQLTTKQRWSVIAYIKSKQGGGAAAADSVGAAPVADTAAAPAPATPAATN